MANRGWKIKARGFALGLGVWLTVVSAVAVDGNVYNGSECTFSEAGEYDGQLRRSIKLSNQSGSTQNISCPLTRDATTGDVEFAYIIANASMDESTCTFWEREDDSSYSTWNNDGVSSISANYNKTKWFSGSSWGNTTNFASYQITCDLNNGGAVLSYYVEEI
jgi:hypothetical protein